MKAAPLSRIIVVALVTTVVLGLMGVLATMSAAGAGALAAHTWETSASYDPPIALSAISCPSASVCFAVGSPGGSSANIVATTNGGSTWTRQTVPPGVSALNAITCPSVRRCFADGTTVIATTNGGESWTIQTLPKGVDGLGDISCPSLSTCYVPTVIGTKSAVIKTTDSGRIWTGHTVPSGGFLDAITCPSVSVCFVAGFVLGRGAVVITTKNGGTTWTNQRVPSGIGDIDSISCPSVTALLCSGRQDHCHRGWRNGLGRTDRAEQFIAQRHRLSVNDDLLRSRGITLGLAS